MAVSDLRQVAANSAADAALEAILTIFDCTTFNTVQVLGQVASAVRPLLATAQPIQPEPEEEQPAPTVKRGNPLLDPSFWVRADRLTPTDDQLEDSEDDQAA